MELEPFIVYFLTSLAVNPIALAMEIYTQVPDKVTREALKRLSDWLGHDQGGGGNQ